MSQKVKREVEEFKRKLLSERHEHLSEKQLALFNRIWPEGVPSKDLEGAIDLCDRTIKKNEAMPKFGDCPECGSPNPAEVHLTDCKLGKEL